MDTDNSNMNIPKVNQIDAEKTSMYQNFANRRLLIALIAVIAGFIIYASIFIVGYTVREQNWMDTIVKITSNSPVATEVTDGVQTN